MKHALGFGLMIPELAPASMGAACIFRYALVQEPFAHLHGYAMLCLVTQRRMSLMHLKLTPVPLRAHLFGVRFMRVGSSTQRQPKRAEQLAFHGW